MADLGTQPHIIEAVLNHVSGHKSGVAGVYNRSAYEPEKRLALEQWAQHLMIAVAKANGANVTKLKKRKQTDIATAINSEFNKRGDRMLVTPDRHLPSQSLWRALNDQAEI